MTTDHEKVLEWFGWKNECGKWFSPDYLLKYSKPENALISPNAQARYFDPYILEKGYWLSMTLTDEGTEIEIWNGCDYIDMVEAKTEALAKREAYIKVCEVENG